MNARGANSRRVVIAGGGVAALEAAIALRSIAGSAPQITLVAPNEDFVYQPMSVGEPFAMGDTPRLPLADFAASLDVDLRQATVDEIGKTHAVLLEGGGFVAYDKLIVAIGAPRVPVYEHATTFRGDSDTQAVHGLIQDLEMGYVSKVAFVVPEGVAWTLPIYELALMAARRAWEMEVDVELTVVTPEDRPLGVFGAAAAEDVAKRLRDSGIRVLCRSATDIPARGQVVVTPGDETIVCDRVIALPVTEGPRLAGLPFDREGFIPIDTHARVVGAHDVYAAGDGTNFPLKQGGIATQQADAAAEDIAYSFGLGPRPEPFRPVLRGRLLTGATPQFMRHDVTARNGADDASDERPLWWPATKIAGKYISAYLAERDASRVDSEEIAPGVKRRAFIAPTSEDFVEMPLRGYEYAGRWSEPVEGV
jgi:sulfide:quinone oxidoreductase